MNKIMGYLKGFSFMERCHSNFQPINSWAVISCHPTYSHTWHWCLYWYTPDTTIPKWRWWTLGFRLYTQKICEIRNRK